MVAPRPFYARTNPSSPPQSPRLRQRPGRQRHWRRDDDDIEAQTAILTHTASRHPFARSWSSSRFEYEGDADSHGHSHGHSRSYDDLGYPRTATYPHTDEAVWISELTPLRHARNTSAASSSSSHTIRDSLSVHATAPPSPAVPVFDRDHPPPPLPLTLPLRVNRRRRQQQQRRPGSIEKPPLDVEEQLAIFASVSNARRAGAGAEARTDTALQLVGSPATSLPSLRPSTTAGTRSGAPRPLPPPPVPPLPSHPREPTRTSPSQDTFDPWDVGMGQPPPYRLLDLH
uniref:Extracellular metalloproteinase 1 ) n=1 Tax=Ganoderma boninense TaxID=34458 RepID=A0A5K1JYG4_9APHY|nr:Extracellular metalloproteinase 1 (EC (Fungalysin MEP1) [Ganoderma boninense]